MIDLMGRCWDPFLTDDRLLRKGIIMPIERPAEWRKWQGDRCANAKRIGVVEGRVVLSDGRRLGYRATGAPDGDPLFYFHGFPGSRLEADLLCKEAGMGGWRVFAIDRPGIGLSDFMPGRTLHDWPRDVEEFANALRIDHFTVIGVSGGGPYAAITAWALKKRVRATGIVCGLGPLQKGAETGPFFGPWLWT